MGVRLQRDRFSTSSWKKRETEIIIIKAETCQLYEHVICDLSSYIEIILKWYGFEVWRLHIRWRMVGIDSQINLTVTRVIVLTYGTTI